MLPYLLLLLEAPASPPPPPYLAAEWVAGPSRAEERDDAVEGRVAEEREADERVADERVGEEKRSTTPIPLHLCTNTPIFQHAKCTIVPKKLM